MLAYNNLVSPYIVSITEIDDITRHVDLQRLVNGLPTNAFHVSSCVHIIFLKKHVLGRFKAPIAVLVEWYAENMPSTASLIFFFLHFFQHFQSPGHVWIKERLEHIMLYVFLNGVCL
ncbi:hypothetical protein BDV26DRAFT_275318 [Aspergillus bertholletiae]|uniref:Uncharacterized protein n=1 Tax=Aspergillus bertholletiae TaxID=1226010 RepID=A0A5N7APP9_9EURO|nr:hypothetical protein BDV26DRAFT_275318 [Aspergillus bertholletiae]